MKLTFAIVGGLGRMGQTIARLSLTDSRLKLSQVFEATDHPHQGKDYTSLTGIPLTHPITVSTISQEKLSGLAGLIDFSTAESSITSANLCALTKTPLVLGTTGFTKEQQALIEKAAQTIAIVQSANMSLGVNVLFALTRQTARVLKDKNFASEIIEIHHKHKKDAPSGTAKTLGKILLQEYGFSEENLRYSRQGIVGERLEREIGVFALRGGDVVGEHTVFFLGEGERLELKHIATSRETFARGALAALWFLQGKPAGLYTMADVLGLT